MHRSSGALHKLLHDSTRKEPLFEEGQFLGFGYQTRARVAPFVSVALFRPLGLEASPLNCPRLHRLLRTS